MTKPSVYDRDTDNVAIKQPGKDNEGKNEE